MLANVLPFKPSPTGQTVLPTPIYYQPDDDLACLHVTDMTCASVGLYPGAIALFQNGLILDGAIHLFCLRGEQVVSRLFRLGDGRLRHGADVLKGEVSPAADVYIFGAMSEFYPVGLDGPRWVVHQPGRARVPIPADPYLFTAQANNVAVTR